jgi:hypothetical protein
MKDQLERGVDGPGRNQPDGHIRRGQHCGVQEVNNHGMSDMADEALLIFEGIAVPVAGGLERKGQHEDGHEDGQDPKR